MCPRNGVSLGVNQMASRTRSVSPSLSHLLVQEQKLTFDSSGRVSFVEVIYSNVDRPINRQTETPPNLFRLGTFIEWSCTANIDDNDDQDEETVHRVYLASSLNVGHLFFGW